MYRIKPESLRAFGDIDGACFVLVKTPSISNSFEIDDTGELYKDYLSYVLEEQAEFTALLEKLPERAHILALLPDIYFRSPDSSMLGPHRKLAVMACRSTPPSVEVIQHFLEQAVATNPQKQCEFVDTFFSQLEDSKTLLFKNSVFDCEAELLHTNQMLTWHEQAGVMRSGDQQLLPSGEVSVLALPVYGEDIISALPFSGTIALQGLAVVHSGEQSFLPADQQRLYESLATVDTRSAVMLTVENGVVVATSTTGDEGAIAGKTMNALFDVDSRYRTLTEIGFGINTEMRPYPGNCAMNEVFGGESGIVHFGFGLSPFTQYHLDILCPGTHVYHTNGHRIFGG